jgi:hypothetical protein
VAILVRRAGGSTREGKKVAHECGAAVERIEVTVLALDGAYVVAPPLLTHREVGIWAVPVFAAIVAFVMVFRAAMFVAGAVLVQAAFMAEFVRTTKHVLLAVLVRLAGQAATGFAPSEVAQTLVETEAHQQSGQKSSFCPSHVPPPW